MSVRKCSAAIVLIAILTLAAGLTVACGGPVPAQTLEPTQEPAIQPIPGDGETLLQERCTLCHSLDRVKRSQKSREEWKQTVSRMVGKGAELSDDEQAVLVDYLAETYGP
ncbi:MAG: hypothetical protein KKC18_06035 [Chloroflexi bacterium]|nr:hypothetical protein [Chloroflexota bacterium]